MGNSSIWKKEINIDPDYYRYGVVGSVVGTIIFLAALAAFVALIGVRSLDLLFGYVALGILVLVNIHWWALSCVLAAFLYSLRILRGKVKQRLFKLLTNSFIGGVVFLALYFASIILYPLSLVLLTLLFR